MGQKSLKVPQPEFSNWVIRKRQELNLSPACLRAKLDDRICERTLKYLEAGRKAAFSEYTLNILAQGLNLSYPDLLTQIGELNSNGAHNGFFDKRPRANRFGWFLLSAVVAAGLLLSRFVLNRDSQLAADEIAAGDRQCLQDVLIHNDYPQIIVAYDGTGNKLWQKSLKTKVRKVEVVDLDQDGHDEVIAATFKNGGISGWGARPGWLLVWNEQGELLTEHNLWKPSIYPAQEPQINVVDFQVADLEKDGTLELVVILQGVEYYPSRLAVLHYQDATFKEVKTYWNPGYLSRLVIEDVDDDGFPEIICTTVNNDLKRLPSFQPRANLIAIFMLQGRSVYGQAPPYLGNAPKGSQIWYRYVTPVFPASKAGDILGVRVAGEGEKEIHLKMGDSCFFYLNYNGEIVGRFDGDDCRWESELHLLPNEATW